MLSYLRYGILISAVLLGLLGLIFYFFTSNVFSVKVNSGIWWFALIFMLTIIFIMTDLVFRYGRGKRRRIIANTLGFFTIALIAATVYLGIRFQPFKLDNIELRMGAILPTDAEDAEIPRQDFTLYPIARNEVDWSDYIPEPINQSTCACCTATASAAVLSSRKEILLRSNQDYTWTQPNSIRDWCPTNASVSSMTGWHVSPQSLVEFGRNKCLGQVNTAGFKSASDLNGAPTSACVPFYIERDNKCDLCDSPSYEQSIRSKKTCVQPTPAPYKYFNCVGSRNPSTYNLKTKSNPPYRMFGEDQMKTEISSNGPIAVVVAYYSGADWTLQSGGYASTVSNAYICRPENDKDYRKTAETYHMMMVYGYGELNGVKYWLVRNSWGSKWGVNGSSKIERGIDAWGIETLGVYSAEVRD